MASAGTAGFALQQSLAGKSKAAAEPAGLGTLSLGRQAGLQAGVGQGMPWLLSISAAGLVVGGRATQ